MESANGDYIAHEVDGNSDFQYLSLEERLEKIGKYFKDIYNLQHKT